MWLFVHLDAPLDSLVLASLWRRLPSFDQAPPRPPLALSRRPDTWADVLAVRGILAGLVKEVVVDDQVTHAEFAAQRLARQKQNAAAIASLRIEASAQHRPIVVFPEGAISDDGLIRISRTGFLQVTAPAATLVISGLAYESFGCSRAEALVCCAPLSLTVCGSAAATVLQKALLRQTPVTLTGLVGYFLLRVRGLPSPRRGVDDLASWIEAAVARLRSVCGLYIHRPLRVAAERDVRIRRAQAQLRQQNYIRENGEPSLRLGPAVDLASAKGAPQANRRGPAPHRLDPLAFWGNRLRQQAADWPELAQALERAFATQDSANGWWPEEEVRSCPIM